MASSEASEGALYQLKDSETEDDIEYEATQSENKNHVPMTTKREIISWWFYDFANSPTVGLGITFLFPIFLTTRLVH